MRRKTLCYAGVISNKGVAMTAQPSQPRITDERLLERLHTLVGKDRRLTAQLLWHLAEVDQRGLAARRRGFCSSTTACPSPGAGP